MKIFGDIERAYFIGAGGIGMSALARYMKAFGVDVAGYDRVSTWLTDSLAREGIRIHFEDDIGLIPGEFRDKSSTLVVYTPAVPKTHREMNFFKDHGFRILKRSEVLGTIMKSTKGIAVSGTHGKTTVSCMIAHILNESDLKCNAFIGGISKNLNSNLLLDQDAEYTVAEADEFDRSFLRLFPQIAIVTSLDPDHLDIYGSFGNLKEDFEKFISQIADAGILILKEGLELSVPSGIRKYTYHLESENASFFPANVSRKGFRYSFDLYTPDKMITSLELGVYGRVNLENAVAALAVTHLMGVPAEVQRRAMASFSGVRRRFDVRIEKEDRIYIDDYAHHPAELQAFIISVREALPGRRISGIFQPHLYSRTRDFAAGFAESLSLLEDVILLDIYPAREEPIPGITSKIILNKLKNSGERILTTREKLLLVLKEMDPEILLTMGAGDIDQLVEPVTELLNDIN